VIEDIEGRPLSAEEVVAKGARAQALLGDPVFQEAVERVEELTIAEWREAVTVEVREQKHSELRALGSVVGALRGIINDGEYARSVLNKQD
jgi:hypothetical protein